jgi:hypothetical protein
MAVVCPFAGVSIERGEDVGQQLVTPHVRGDRRSPGDDTVVAVVQRLAERVAAGAAVVGATQRLECRAFSVSRQLAHLKHSRRSRAAPRRLTTMLWHAVARQESRGL